MNQHIFSKRLFFIAVTAFAVIGAALLAKGMFSAEAQTASPYTMTGGTVAAVDANAQTVTLNLSTGMMGTCPSTGCPPNSMTLTWGQVLAIDTTGQIINSVGQMQVGDSVTLYEKSSAPYALKDNTQNIGTGGVGAGVSGGSTSSGPATGSGVGAASGAVVYSSLGESNPAILSIQQKLQVLGYFPQSVSPTGYFGQTTLSAVKSFQSAKNLPATGLVGPLTRSALGL